MKSALFDTDTYNWFYDKSLAPKYNFVTFTALTVYVFIWGSDVIWVSWYFKLSTVACQKRKHTCSEHMVEYGSRRYSCNIKQHPLPLVCGNSPGISMNKGFSCMTLLLPYMEWHVFGLFRYVRTWPNFVVSDMCVDWVAVACQRCRASDRGSVPGLASGR